MPEDGLYIQYSTNELLQRINEKLDRMDEKLDSKADIAKVDALNLSIRILEKESETAALVRERYIPVIEKSITRIEALESSRTKLFAAVGVILFFLSLLAGTNALK